jgi:5-methylthioadenosine/S-adenosylhomocysteine deaminase
MKKLLVDCWLLPDFESPLLRETTVAVEEGKIVETGKTSDLKKKYADWPVESMNGNLVMPGLINTHTHMPMALLRGRAEDLTLDAWLAETRRFRENHYNDQISRLAVETTLMEALKAGVTTIADMTVGQPEYVDIVEKSGLRAVLYETVMDYVYPGNCSGLLDFLEGQNNSLVKRGAALHAPYSCSESLLNWFRQEIIIGSDCPLSIHLAETRGEEARMMKKWQKVPLDYLDGIGFFSSRLLAIHSIWLDATQLQLLAERGVSISHNPECNMKIGAGVAPIKEALEAGINVSLGTDSQASNNDQDIFGEMKTAALLQKVTHRNPCLLPATRVIKMATVNGARALGLEKVGRLLPGWQADLTVIDINDLRFRPVHDPAAMIVYNVNGSDVIHTMVGGNWLLKNKKILSFDEQEIYGKLIRFESGIV